MIWGLHLNAQEIEVTYQATAKHVKNSSKETNDFTKKLANYANSALPNINFKVISNGSVQKFFYEEAMISDFNGKTWLNVAILIAIDGKQIYSDYSNNKSYYESNQISKIRSVEIDNIDWTIVNESKIIMDYKCYKATAKIKDVNKEDKLSPPSIAWFCPDLNYNGGPTPYASLPGFILELESEKIKFTATKVEIKKNNSIKIPQYKSEDVLPHIEWNNYFAKNNPVSRLRN